MMTRIRWQPWLIPAPQRHVACAELRQQVDGLKEELRSKAAAVCAATAELEATRLETERLRRKKARRDEEVTALAVQVQKMQARLDERVENLQAQVGSTLGACALAAHTEPVCVTDDLRPACDAKCRACLCGGVLSHHEPL